MGVRHRVSTWIAAAAVAAIGLAACGGSSRSTQSVAGTGAASFAACPATGAAAGTASASGTGSWPYPNGTMANTRDVRGSTITSGNVSTLRERWTFKLTGEAAADISGTGSLASNPIVRDGVVYLQDLHSNVYALSLGTGKLLWECRLDRTITSGPGPNGVAVADGLVFGQTPTTAFALNARTGRKVWANSALLRPGQGTFGIQPAVADGRVYLASQVGNASGGGVLLGLQASSGRQLWKFKTYAGASRTVPGGGAWDTPLAGSAGSVTFGTGNPYRSTAVAIAHPSRQLYTDSDVDLDGATGRLRWYFQGVTDDFKDYDMQTSPIATRIGATPVVIGSGKMGIVYAIDSDNGRLLWKSPVGEHNGHDDDSLDALEHRSALKAPYTILPGSFGGVESDLALAGNTVYVATCNLPFTVKSMTAPLGTPTMSLARATGDLEALNLATGKVEWDTRLSGLPLGAATVSQDLVFTTLYPGILLALDRRTGAIVERLKLPTSTNSPIAIAGNTVLVPAGGPTAQTPGGDPQLVAYSPG
jgi:alcohol dehydrogenase (cytochrome c)